jgi:hypothetical protein
MTKSGPSASTVGASVVFTFSVTNDDPAGEGWPLENIAVSDDIAGPANYADGDQNEDGLLQVGETWIYTCSLIIQPTHPSPLVNIGTVVGHDRNGVVISSTAVHSTTIGFAPWINILKHGPDAASVGETVLYTFTVSNVSYTPTSVEPVAGAEAADPVWLQPAAYGDGSPLANIAVVDSIAGSARYVVGDDGDGLLEMGEAWVYNAAYTVLATDPNPLVNIGTATGVNGNGDPVQGTASHSLRVEYRPALRVEATGPAGADVGEAVVFSFAVSHDPESDGSPVRGLVVTSTYGSPVVLIGGDANHNSQLDANEVWAYSAFYTIQPTDPGWLHNTCIVTAQDQQGDPVTAVGAHTLIIEGTHLSHLPFIYRTQ